MIPSVQEKRKKKHVLISLVIALCVVLLAAGYALDYVQVPYTVEETYPVEETYEDIEFYNSTEEYPVLIPDVAQVAHEQEISIGTPTDHLETEPAPLTDKDCSLEYYDYTLHYSSPAHERNKYDPITKAGYYDGAVRIMATICNEERRAMYTDFLQCDYWRENKVECDDHLIVIVPAKSCIKRLLVWRTAFDAEKTIALEMGEVSRKLMCKTNYANTGKSGPEYSVVSYMPEVGDYKKYAKENIRLKTRSGYLATPKNTAGFYPDEVSTARQTFVKDVVTYRQENRERNITLNRTVVKTRSVDKTRSVTEYRSLLEDLQARFEKWCVAREMC